MYLWLLLYMTITGIGHENNCVFVAGVLCMTMHGVYIATTAIFCVSFVLLTELK